MPDNILSYKAHPTCKAFHQSPAFVRGIMGPYGSGKSVACCWEIFRRALSQEPGMDGVRRTRWIVARNTLPQLETTTIKTWLDWFPEHIFGKMNRKPPYTHHLYLPAKKIGDDHDVSCEVIFLALDKPEDQKKLLSFEVTGVWFNEARETDYSLVSAATGRVGRYPASKDKPEGVEKWPTWSGIIMDTNPPDDEHWWYKADVEDSWAFDEDGNRVNTDEVSEQYKWEFFSQPSGLSDEAENIDNLPGGYGYYRQMLGGKSKEWIDVHVHGKYGFVKHGLPVYGSSFSPDRHVREGIELRPGGTIYVGVDASGRHPAAIFAQRTMHGQWQTLHELCIQEDQGMGAVAFARLLKSEMKSMFPDHDFRIWGDPAGDWKSQNDENTYFDILRANGIMIKSSPGLRIPDRLETVRSVLEQNIGSQPKIVFDKKCKVLLRGFNGGYRYRQLNVSGDTRHDEKPEKNRYSDVQDALQYLLCGAGEMQAMKLGQSHARKGTVKANTGFNVFTDI